MLDDGRQRHIERPRELGDRGRPAAQAVEQAATGGITQGLEDEVEPIECGRLPIDRAHQLSVSYSKANA